MAGRPKIPQDQVERGRRLGGLIRNARMSAFPQQSEAEFAISHGLSHNTLRKLETDTANPGFFVVDKLARILDLDLNELAANARGEVSE